MAQAVTYNGLTLSSGSAYTVMDIGAIIRSFALPQPQLAFAVSTIDWEDCEPTCDICGIPQHEDPDWNGETGNHESCEASLRARREPHPREFAVRDVSTCNCDACTMVPEVPE